MASFLKGLMGADPEPAQRPVAEDSDGFADFANADPSPVPLAATGATAAAARPAPTLSATAGGVPYTAWYRVWERTQPSDFYQEMFVVPFVLLMLLVHVFGIRGNRRKARDWAAHHAPVLGFEFARVGFVPGGKQVAEAAPDGAVALDSFWKETTASEYAGYATGRANVAFVDLRITLAKRFNPLIMFGERAIGFLFDSFPVTVEKLEATAYAFDSREATIIPRRKDDPAPKVSNSSYDGFVFAIVHKRMLRKLREDRYDLSLTTTKEHPKLPHWAAVLTESAEVTDLILTPELIKAVEDAGELFDALIITDQPMDRPTKLNETSQKKRMTIALRLPSNSKDYLATLPIFTYFLRLPDFLVQHAHFRPEAIRKIRQIREDEIKRIKKADDEEKAEERKLKGDKEKKEKRDALLNALSGEEQKKFLDKEREKDLRRSQKKRTMRG